MLAERKEVGKIHPRPLKRASVPREPASGNGSSSGSWESASCAPTVTMAYESDKKGAKNKSKKQRGPHVDPGRARKSREIPHKDTVHARKSREMTHRDPAQVDPRVIRGIQCRTKKNGLWEQFVPRIPVGCLYICASYASRRRQFSSARTYRK